jgi:hypothetical protein
MLFAWGTIILFVMMRVFWFVVQIDSKLSKRAVKLLALEQHANERALIVDGRNGEVLMSDERKAELLAANALISVMCKEITLRHVSLKLFKFMQLREDVLVKFGGAIGAALFTTALRQSLNKYCKSCM